MRAVSFKTSTGSASFVALHSFVVVDVESDVQNFVKVSIGDSLTDWRVPVRLFEPQTDRKKEAWPTICHVDEIPNPPRVVLRKQETGCPGLLRASKYQLCAELMTVTSRTYGKLGAINADTMLQQSGKSAFSETRLRSLFSTVPTVFCAFKSSLHLHSPTLNEFYSPIG